MSIPTTCSMENWRKLSPNKEFVKEYLVILLEYSFLFLNKIICTHMLWVLIHNPQHMSLWGTEENYPRIITTLGKKISANDLLNIFLIFPRKQVLIFYANCLQ